MKIAVFYHALFCTGDPPDLNEHAVAVVHNQMLQLRTSGLLEAASEFVVGLNEPNRMLANLLIPAKARLVLHGFRCRNENRTIRSLEEWLPGHEDYYVLYFHAKGASHSAESKFHKMTTYWRECMMANLVDRWERCVSDLNSGYEAVGCHWMEYPDLPEGHRYFAGNFFWAKASFLRTLPSILERERIKLSGLDAPISRYEAEVWLGNGARAPKRRDYHGPWDPGKWETCKPKARL